MLKDHQMESYVPGHDVVFHPYDLYNLSVGSTPPNPVTVDKQSKHFFAGGQYLPSRTPLLGVYPIISGSFQREKVGSLGRVPDSQFVPDIFPPSALNNGGDLGDSPKITHIFRRIFLRPLAHCFFRDR